MANQNVSSNNNNTISNENQYTYEEIEKIADFLKTEVSLQPQIGIICGSGLGSIGETVTDSVSINFKDIPNFPVSTVQSHAGKLLFGYISGTPVMCMQGRFHFYEGYPLWKCVLPIRVMKLLGVNTLIISNAAGGLNSSFKLGDIMLIKDHISFPAFAGNNPLRGPNEERFGPRFVALNDAYNPNIIKNVQLIAKELGLTGIHEGVYACLGGPNYETVAELRALKTLGVDAVGMSTVHEVIAARHCNMNCFAFSLITNECVMEYDTDDKPNHEEVLNIASQKEKDVKILIENIVPKLAQITA